MGLSLNILKEYCRNQKEIGSIIPDSNTCVSSLLSHVPFDSAKVIVEFGSASGAVTGEIIRRKRPDTIFVSFEKNQNLYAKLIKRYSGENNTFLINADVFNCAQILDSIPGVEEHKVDCIVSTLPCSSINFNVLIQRSVLPILRDTGYFVQYMHSLSLLKGFNLKNHLVKYFNNIVSDFVLFNMPPALVYSCHSAYPSHKYIC